MTALRFGVEGRWGAISSRESAFRKHGCTTVSTSLVKGILAHPRSFYVNVHNAAFPGGAVRGQLKP